MASVGYTFDARIVSLFEPATIRPPDCQIIFMFRFNNISPNIQAALIGALVTLLGILIKDLLIAHLQERKKSEKDLQAVFRKYADPLSSAATSRSEERRVGKE